MQSPVVFIVMGVYDGARFLWEQFCSIADQTERQWRLLVRDDSPPGVPRDESRVILERMSADPRVSILEDDLGRLGPVGNYSRLLQSALDAGAHAVFLADQDDYWKPRKLESQLAHLKRFEASRPGVPLVLHSDLVVVDADRRRIANSFMRRAGLVHRRSRALETLAIQNFATGCTMLVNRPLLEAALPIPPQAVMHDWWLAIVAASVGAIDFSPEPWVEYRQHGNNTVGAREYWGSLRSAAYRAVGALGTFEFSRQLPSELLAAIEQAWWAGAWVRPTAPAAADLLQDFAELWRSKRTPGTNLAKLRKLGVCRQDVPRQLLLQLRLLLAKHDDSPGPVRVPRPIRSVKAAG